MTTIATATLPKNVQYPQYDRSQLRSRIVHFGFGAFHRAHQALLTDRVLNNVGGDWGICEISLFSGDTLFAGDVGRTDLPGGSWDTLRKSLKKLCAAVTENVQVLPGHEEFSTMDRERANNRYLQF